MSDTLKKYCAVGVLALAVVLSSIGCVVYAGGSSAAGIVLTALGGAALAGAVFVYLKCPRPLEFNSIGFAAAAALFSFTVGETCIGAYVFKGFVPYMLLGYVLYAAVYVLGAVIFKRPKIWFCVFEVLFSVYAAAQYYLILFRESPVKFVDLQNLRSAAEIKSEYALTMSLTIGTIIVQTAAVLFLTIRSRIVTEEKRPRLIALGAVLVCGGAFAFTARAAYDHGIDSGEIRMNFSGSEEVANSQKAGNLLMFVCDAAFNRFDEPEGYSDEKAAALTAGYTVDKSEGKQPVIIAILNESWADYSTISPLQVTGDYLPVWRSLEENTVKGYVTISPYGGYTCNSEYEFLTGNSMYFLPLGSSAYTNYLDGAEDGIVTHLNSLGYETVAYTPCSRVLWDIGGAYEKLGFRTCCFGDEIGVDMDVKINGQLADAELFRGVERLVDERDKSKGLFVWVTTMQNHASYSVPVEGGVKLNEPYDEAAERYLNCVYQSDKAIGELIGKYKDSEDEVVILMFGDHFPHIPGYADTLYGRGIAGLSAEEYSRMHRTPYLIWTNRDIEERRDDNVSLNYLGAEVMKAAGLPLSAVQQELEHLRETLPVISSFGLRTASGDWYANGEKPSGAESALEEYSTLQYYRMFGKK